MPAPTKHRCAVLDDYQNVALSMADWASLAGEIDVTTFNHPLGPPEAIVKALQGFSIVVLTRERTAFPRQVIERLPDLRLIVTTGARNPALDLSLIHI